MRPARRRLRHRTRRSLQPLASKGCRTGDRKSSVVGGSRHGRWRNLAAGQPGHRGYGGSIPRSAQTAYLESVVGEAPARRHVRRAYLPAPAGTVDMLHRTTPMKLFWARNCSITTPEAPVVRRRSHLRMPATGRISSGNTCRRCAPGVMEVSFHAHDERGLRWLNLMSRVPRKVPGRRQTTRTRSRVAAGTAVRHRRSGAGGRPVPPGPSAPGIDLLNYGLDRTDFEQDRVSVNNRRTRRSAGTRSPARRGKVVLTPAASTTRMWTCGGNLIRVAWAAI